jgi:hypothetical protein
MPSINDSAYPSPVYATFGDLAVGEDYRTPGAAYRSKTSVADAYDWATFAQVAQAAGDAVQRVSAVLVISAPA